MGSQRARHDWVTELNWEASIGKLKAGIPWAVQWLGLSHWVWSWPLSHMLSLGLILGLETKIPTSHVAKNKWISSKKEIWQSLKCRLEGKGEAGEGARAKSRTQVRRWNSLSSWKWRGSSNQPSEQGKRSDTNQQLGSEPNRQYKEQGSPNRSDRRGLKAKFWRCVGGWGSHAKWEQMQPIIS